ncbi:calcium-binding EGF-like domain-containing protein, partial [Salmonella sp. s54836]|uniref:calcium-binding EGF-like domain-containing protein n=1 Tax=Salmonella sp. s54836 TaxID=3159673 RepID=UPI00397FD610
SIDINECNHGIDMCPNGVECINSLGDYSCNCSGNKTGKTCNLINECSSDDICKAGRICINTESVHLCVDSEIVTKITTTQVVSVQEIIDLVMENLKSNKTKREVITRDDCKIYVQKLYDNSKEYLIVSQCQNNGIITSSSYVDF